MRQPGEEDRPTTKEIVGFFALIILAILMCVLPTPGFSGGPDYDFSLKEVLRWLGTANVTIATTTTTLLNCTATGTFKIPTVAPESPEDGMIWFEP